jgi:hypothetical protein
METPRLNQSEPLIKKSELTEMALPLTIFLVFMVLMLADANAQKIWEVRKGCIRTQGNLAAGYLFQQKAPSAYINGDMDLFFDDRTAFFGSVWYSFALNRRNETGLKANHAVFAGINYHFLKPKRWDPFIGLSPGLGITQAAYREGDMLKKTPYTPVPLVSATLGCNYYIGSIFHFFVKVQGVTGQMFSNLPSPVRVDELKCMAGLGWNMRLWKPRVKDRWKDSNHRERGS